MNLILSPTAETIKARAEAAWHQQLAEEPTLRLMANGPLGETIKEGWLYGFSKGVESALQDVQEVMAPGRRQSL